MLWHLGGVEHHWLQHVTTGVMDEPPAAGEAAAGGGEEDEAPTIPGPPSPAAGPAPTSSPATATQCRRSDEVLAVTPLSAAPRGLGFHPDPQYTRQITNVRWIVLHVIEETAAHSGHLEIARELLDGKTRLGGR